MFLRILIIDWCNCWGFGTELGWAEATSGLGFKQALDNAELGLDVIDPDLSIRSSAKIYLEEESSIELNWGQGKLSQETD